MKIEIQTYPGDTFDAVALKAKKKAMTTPNAECWFDFNGVRCVVGADTDTVLLYRDYANAHIMEWKEVGPVCEKEYSPSVQSELDKRNKAQAEKEERQRIEWRKKEAKERKAFERKVRGILFDVVDPNGYNEWKEKNSDPYGAATFEYAEGWAKLMQAEISTGKTVVECAEKTSFELGFLGITGFMYGFAVSILSQHWKHGEELRKWHNKEYNHEGNGVVNPAVITISDKTDS